MDKINENRNKWLTDFFLKELFLLQEKYKDINENKEKFNIFSVLHKEHDERRLHSRFIAALLDPYASHKQKFGFLYEFIRMFPKLDIKNFEHAIVYPEDWNKKENSNIDILIIDKTSKHAIIIENKIYAGDSNNEESGQLERYFDHVKDKESIPIENIKTFYLTLDGHEPSNESLGKYKEIESVDVQCISYEIEVLNWLNRCIPMVVQNPFIRETIFQYQNLIKKMTHNEANIQERLEIRGKIGKNEENMKAAKYLVDNFKHVKWHTVRDFWNELAMRFKRQGFKIKVMPTDEQVTDLTHFETYRKGQKIKQSCGLYVEVNKELVFFIQNESESFLYWGFVDNQQISDQNKNILNNLYKENTIRKSNSYWWQYCLNEDNERLVLSNFHHQATFNLISSQKQEEKTKMIFKEIIDFLNKYFRVPINIKY